MKFSHSYSVSSCFKCSSFSHTSEGSANWSLFYLLLAAGAALPLWIYLMFPPWSFPWYYFPSILAGEMLLFYFAGFLTSFLLAFTSIRYSRCPKCKAPLGLAGNYFTKGDPPNRHDIALCIIYVSINIAFWFALLTDRL